jgi:signal peptide peptidase SppA
MKPLTTMALPHGVHWAIEPAAARQLWQALSLIDADDHRREFEAARSPIGMSGEDRPYEIVDGVAYLYLSGPMTKKSTSFSSGCSTVRMREMVRQAARDDMVNANMHRVDSPGGSVAGTDDLARDVAAANKKKPVGAYVEDCCCSAAYWVACQGSKIWTNATAVIGSIGTYAVIDDLSGAYEQAGVKVHVLSTGPHKGAGVEGAEVTDEQLAEFQRSVDELNAHFLNAVNKGRRFGIERTRSLADGRVHVGQAAVDLGLADAVAPLERAHQELLSMAKEPSAGSARAELVQPILAQEDQAPITSTFEADLHSALTAVSRVDERMNGVADIRESQNRAFSLEKLARAKTLHEALGATIARCESLGRTNDPAEPEAPAAETCENAEEVLADLRQATLMAELAASTH